MTKDYVILTDATSDIPQPLVEKYNLDYIPMEVNFGEETFKQYLDERDLKLSDFYARLDNKELATTTLINMQTFIDKFTPYLEKGIDVIFIGLSSALSASYSQALIAKEELSAAFPLRKIVIIDSKGASVAEGALVVEALEKQKAGASFDEVVKHVKSLIQHVIAFFVPINLETLRRGGRIGAVKAVIGDAIGIKPILQLDSEGKIVELSKARGFKRALTMLVDLTKDRVTKPYKEKFYIVHASNSAAATVVADLFKAEHGGGQAIIGPLGPVISAHTGTGAVCLVFFGSHR
ncbi:MAG TPA: DegV family protein [Bacilli bacterium]|nr:DegV family protein [Bacilli bacterium]